MRDYILSQKPNAFTYNTRVTAISLTNTGDIQVAADANNHASTFRHVISTIPLPVLRTVDLSQANLSPMQSNALRELNYGPAIKVGIQFRTGWWTTKVNNKGVKLNIVGGQSYVDSMLRTIVYPSFGDDIANGMTTTLIASYCWTEDAARFGAIINNANANDDDRDFLKKFVLKELATIHDLDIEFLNDQYLDMHAWSWSHNPYSMGELLPDLPILPLSFQFSVYCGH